MPARDSAIQGKFEPPKLRFEIQSPGLPARTMELQQDIVKIGKLSSSHIQIQDPAVSRVHAVIEVTPQGEVYIIDLGSSNGTYVNGERVSKERLNTGDEVRLGQTRVKVIVGGDELNVTHPVGAEAAAVADAPSEAAPPAPPAEPEAPAAAPEPEAVAAPAAEAPPPPEAAPAAEAVPPPAEAAPPPAEAVPPPAEAAPPPAEAAPPPAEVVPPPAEVVPPPAEAAPPPAEAVPAPSASPAPVAEPDLFAATGEPEAPPAAPEAPAQEAAPPPPAVSQTPPPAEPEAPPSSPEPAAAAGPIGTPGPLEPAAPVLTAPPSTAKPEPAEPVAAQPPPPAAPTPPRPQPSPAPKAEPAPPAAAAPTAAIPAVSPAAAPQPPAATSRPAAVAPQAVTPAAATAAQPPVTKAPARPPEPVGRERRFIAISAAEPVSALTSRTVEARLAFGPDVIEARTFEAGKPSRLRWRGGRRAMETQYRKAADVTIGPYPTCDFMIDVPGPFAVLRATADGFVYRFREQTLGRVRLGDRDIDLSDLKNDPETETGEEPGVYEWPFHQGALVSMKVGGTTLYLRSVPKTPPPPVVYFQTRDPKLLLAFLGVAIFSGALVWRAVTWPATPDALLEDRAKIDDRMVSFLINPEERLRRAKIFGARIKEKEEGGALKGKEGKSGTPDAPKRKRRLAIKGKQKELTPAQRRERDLRKVRRVGALAAMEKDAVLKEIFGAGAGGTPGSPFGRGVGAGPNDMTAWGGVGDGPPGEGYGLRGFGGQGSGTGGGGMGRYVGVGRLATRGIGGGRRGADIGSGRARFKEHQVEKPKVIMEEPDVGGGLTKEIIRRVIRSHLHEIRYCYNRELKKDPRLYGKIVVKFTILPSGNVFKSRIKRTTMNNENVERCMLARVVRWKFPKPYKGSSVIVSYPFLFKSAGR